MSGKAIGGFIELEENHGVMYHNAAIKLNCGRNALEYLLKAKSIKKIYMPRYMCNSCDCILRRNKVDVEYYSINKNFEPIVKIDGDSFIYIVNYFGQVSAEIIKQYGKNVIVDNAHAYFDMPLVGIDTIYTCRKWFGVPDGAILYTNRTIQVEEREISYERMEHLMGRFELGPEEFYCSYRSSEDLFDDIPLRKMSRLTENILKGIDYEFVINARVKNYILLAEYLSKYNSLELKQTKVPFMYPLYVENGDYIRKKLREERIYIPILWPNVLDDYDANELERNYAKNILPLPIDQRYDNYDMQRIINTVIPLLSKK